MPFLIHRSPRGPGLSNGPQLLLVGGDGRWVLPLLRLMERLGFPARWVERSPPELGSAATGASGWVLQYSLDEHPVPLIALTGSLLGLSTAVSSSTVVPLPWPITREELETALRTLDKSP